MNKKVNRRGQNTESGLLIWLNVNILAIQFLLTAGLYRKKINLLLSWTLTKNLIIGVIK